MKYQNKNFCGIITNWPRLRSLSRLSTIEAMSRITSILSNMSSSMCLFCWGWQAPVTRSELVMPSVYFWIYCLLMPDSGLRVDFFTTTTRIRIRINCFRGVWAANGHACKFCVIRELWQLALEAPRKQSRVYWITSAGQHEQWKSNSTHRCLYSYVFMHAPTPCTSTQIIDFPAK